jgi:hypothetical protein
MVWFRTIVPLHEKVSVSPLAPFAIALLSCDESEQFEIVLSAA